MRTPRWGPNGCVRTPTEVVRAFSPPDPAAGGTSQQREASQHQAPLHQGLNLYAPLTRPDLMGAVMAHTFECWARLERATYCLGATPEEPDEQP